MTKLLIDLMPAVVFFAVYQFHDIFVATGALMAAMAAQLVLLLVVGRKIETMHKAAFAMVVVFGGLTLVLRDQTFIQWKPTVVYWSLAVGLLLAQFAFRRNPAKLLLGKAVELPDRAWGTLNLGWGLFFLAMGVLNLVVMYNATEAQWVKIRTFGYPGLTLIFVLAQAAIVFRQAKTDSS